jgi:hypothetical protein
LFYLRLAIVFAFFAIVGCEAAKAPQAPAENYRVTFESGELSAFNLTMTSTPKGIRCQLRNNDPNFTVNSAKILLKTGADSRFVEVDVDVKPNTAAEFYVRSNGYALTPGAGLVSVDASRLFGGTGTSKAESNEVSVRYGATLDNSDPFVQCERRPRSHHPGTSVQQDSPGGGGGALGIPAGVTKVGH